MACACKNKSAAQPTAIKQVTKSKEIVTPSSVKTSSIQAEQKRRVVKRIMRRAY